MNHEITVKLADRSVHGTCKFCGREDETNIILVKKEGELAFRICKEHALMLSQKLSSFFEFMGKFT